MSNRKLIEDNELEEVSGGIEVYNNFGDSTRYAFRQNGASAYQYYYNADDTQYINQIIIDNLVAGRAAGLTDEQIDANTFQLLINSPYAHRIPGR